MTLKEDLLAIGLAFVMLAVTHGLIYQMGAMSSDVEHREELERISNKAAQSVIDAQAESRAKERASALHMAALDEQHHKELQNEIDSKERAIADVRAGTQRVRDEFTCPAAAAKGGAAKAGTAASVGHAAGAGGLQAAHVEFLLREAGRADEAVMQLQACQAVVQADRDEASQQAAEAVAAYKAEQSHVDTLRAELQAVRGQ